MRLCVRTHGKLCDLRVAICVLRPAAYFAYFAQAAAQAAARKLERAGRIVFYVCVRAIAFMFIYNQHASEIAGNSVELLVEIQRKLKYVQLGAACGPRQCTCMNQSSQFTHSTFRAACGKV